MSGVIISVNLLFFFFPFGSHSSPQQLRMIKGNEQPGKNVLFLRNVEDAHRIAKEVKGKSVLILGSSFIGTFLIGIT